VGRQSRNSADYFYHIAKPGQTVFILERRWGNNGYSFWFKLLELLTSSEGHFYDYRNDAGREYFRARMNLSEGISDTEILNLLADRGNIDKALWTERGILWCQALVDSLSETLYVKRKKGAPCKPSVNSDISGSEIPPQQNNRAGYTSSGVISEESVLEGSKEVKAGRQARDVPAEPLPAASFASLLKDKMSAAGVALRQTDMDAIASRIIASQHVKTEADLLAFLTWALEKCKNARQTGTYLVICLTGPRAAEYDWIGKWRASVEKGSAPARKPAEYPKQRPVDLTEKPTPELELAEAWGRHRLHLPLTARDKQLLRLALTAEEKKSLGVEDAPVDDFPDDPLPGPQPEFPEATS
jgi:hypothetical protein